MRKSLRGKRVQAEFECAKAEISELYKQETTGEIALYYFDEAGFNLTPEVPYAWQEVGETIEIPSQRSKRLNVLGFCNKELDFHATTIQGWVTSDTVIECFDQFCDKIDKKTIVILDNASIHTSKKFKAKVDGWQNAALRSNISQLTHLN